MICRVRCQSGGRQRRRPVELRHMTSPTSWGAFADNRIELSQRVGEKLLNVFVLQPQFDECGGGPGRDVLRETALDHAFDAGDAVRECISHCLSLLSWYGRAEEPIREFLLDLSLDAFEVLAPFGAQL